MIVALAADARAATEAEFLAAAKRIPVHRLDPRLPEIGLERWLLRTTGTRGAIVWETNDCGEACGCPADSGRDLPVCVEARAVLPDSSTALIQIAMGTLSKGIWGEPGLFYSEIAGPGPSVATFDSLAALASALAGRRR